MTPPSVLPLPRFPLRAMTHRCALFVLPLVAAGLGLLAPSAQAKEWFTLDTRATTIRWEGFSLRGSHEGTLRASGGWLRRSPAGLVVGGEVVVPLASLDVTDFPDHPGSRARLREHLLAEDFFWAARHPTARIVVTGATRLRDGRMRLATRLTMRGVTHPVSVDATERVLPDGRIEVRARLRLDRQRWGVRFQRARDLVVRDAFDLDVRLVAAPRV